MIILHSLKLCPFFNSQAIDSIHQVGLYCLALVPANTLPKTPLGGIHICETKQNFLEGNLHPCNILMCPHTCVTNLPKPRQKQPGSRISSCSTISYRDISEILHVVVCVVVDTLFSDPFSGCRTCFDAGRQLGGREAGRPGYRQRAGCIGRPGSDPKGADQHTDPQPHKGLNNDQSFFL